MRNARDLNDKPLPLSVTVVTVAAFWVFSLLAVLTITTHLSQLLAVSFRFYAYVCLILSVITSCVVFVVSRRDFKANPHVDTSNIFWILVLGLTGVFLSVTLHRTGRLSPDEYYAAANPVYYVQHPDAAMGFESRTFYSEQPIYSVSYITAGAYEYIEAAVAFLAHASFVDVYYWLGAGLTGFLIPPAIFLAVYCFSGDAFASILGTFITLCAIVLTGETGWTPGAYSFLRAFEGKALLLFAGIPFLMVFSLTYFTRPSTLRWWRLLALVTALAGISSSSFLILPILGFILFLSWWIASRGWTQPTAQQFKTAAAYFLAFLYLVLFAFYVSRTDHLQNAYVFNDEYPATFSGYLNGFVEQRYPVTPILFLAFTLLALLLARGRSRALLGIWVVAVILLVLNPLAARFYLLYFQGVYFRLFYLLPFPLVVGLGVAWLYLSLQAMSFKPKVVLWSAVCLMAVGSTLLIPSSLFRSPVVRIGNWTVDQDLVRARAILAVVPRGVMLAPYPLSGAIRMLESEAPQMITRNDLMLYYLGLQGRDEDARLRIRVKAFLTGDHANLAPLEKLLGMYPEIRSVVLYDYVYGENRAALDALLAARGFRNKSDILDLVVFSN